MKKAKDETISSLRQHIQTLQSIIDTQRQNVMNYQLPIGVAEKKEYVKK